MLVVRSNTSLPVFLYLPSTTDAITARGRDKAESGVYSNKFK